MKLPVLTIQNEMPSGLIIHNECAMKAKVTFPAVFFLITPLLLSRGVIRVGLNSFHLRQLLGNLAP